MSTFDRDTVINTEMMTPAEAAAIDAGLRAYMLRVYNYMMLGLALTGLAALAIYYLSVTNAITNASYILRGHGLISITSGISVQAGDILLTPVGYLVFFSPLKWAIFLAPLAFVFALSLGVGRMRPASAQILYWIYAALVGLSLGAIFIVYAHTSIARVFFITAAAFGALSLWGYTTKRNLSAAGAFLTMGLLGVIAATVVNLFLASSMLQGLVSVVGVLVFAGLTAWDTQRLKSEYLYGALDGEALERSAVMGALSLYLDFLNLFTLLLQIFGHRDD